MSVDSFIINKLTAHVNRLLFDSLQCIDTVFYTQPHIRLLVASSIWLFVLAECGISAQSVHQYQLSHVCYFDTRAFSLWIYNPACFQMQSQPTNGLGLYMQDCHTCDISSSQQGDHHMLSKTIHGAHRCGAGRCFRWCSPPYDTPEVFEI